MTSCLLDYDYFNKYYKIITTDLSKQREHDADPKSIQQTNFAGNLARGGKMLFLIKEAKENFSDFSQGTVELL